jgi:hypothetical protein
MDCGCSVLFMFTIAPGGGIVFVGHELSLVQQYACVGVLAFPLFWMAGAGAAVFWVIGWYLFKKNWGPFLLDCKLVEIKPAVVLACKFVNFTALSSQDQDFSRPC